MLDQPRPAATSPDQYTLTVEETLVRYDHAGHPRTARAIQRYCAKAHLDCLRQETIYGDRYMITLESVARHIAQIDELASANSRDRSRPAATAVVAPAVAEHKTPEHEQQGATSPDPSRTVATGRDVSPDVGHRVVGQVPADDRYVKQLEGEVVFLRDQVQRKDMQIGELTERAKETNFLIKGLQDLVLRLQPGRPREHIDPQSQHQE